MTEDEILQIDKVLDEAISNGRSLTEFLAMVVALLDESEGPED